MKQRMIAVKMGGYDTAVRMIVCSVCGRDVVMLLERQTVQGDGPDAVRYHGGTVVEFEGRHAAICKRCRVEIVAQDGRERAREIAERSHVPTTFVDGSKEYRSVDAVGGDGGKVSIETLKLDGMRRRPAGW